MSMLTLDGTEPAADRAALQALVRWQSEAPVDALPRLDEPRLRAALAAFRAACLPASLDAAAWERLSRRLIDDLLAQPVVALQATAPWGGEPLAGPVTHDIAWLLRRAPLDEALELDLAVRWWQQARVAGVPVDADFGECWRALEWTGLAWQLALLARQPKEKATLDHLLMQVNKVALRYGPLKPLLKWLEPWSGTRVGAGYTF